MNKISMNLYVLFGWISAVLGFIGMFVPLLPTVPFFLLASWCFSKGSPKFHAWILANKYAGPIIADWERNHSIAKHVQVKAIILVILTCGVSAYVVEPFILKLMLVTIATCVSLFILTRNCR